MGEDQKAQWRNRENGLGTEKARGNKLKNGKDWTQVFAEMIYVVPVRLLAHFAQLYFPTFPFRALPYPKDRYGYHV